MPKRTKLGLIFSVNEQWIGGTYYILNLISALKMLPKPEQPVVVILSKKKEDFEVARQTGYKYLKYRNPYFLKRNLLEKVIDKISIIITGKYQIDKRISDKDIDVIFPSTNEFVFQKISRKIFWFADFQHIALPVFFDAKEINERNTALNIINENGQGLILSSKAAKRDWDELPFQKKVATHVIPFAVTHPVLNQIEPETLMQEYGLCGKYFIVSNQFWAHKNHLVVLKAINLLKETGSNIQIVMTGKEDDYRNPEYFKQITQFIDQHGLGSRVILTGFIEREKQLRLMQFSWAVIQPSLFEGWSTVLEDAKSLGCRIIASDILIHREQLENEECLFFEALNEHDLAENMKKCLLSAVGIKKVDYNRNILQFGNQFKEVIKHYCE